MDETNKRERSITPSLEAGLDIIEIISMEREKSFGELCESLPLSRASVARILQTLTARGYVRKDESRNRWVPGSRMVLAGFDVPIARLLKKEANEILESYMRATGNSVICVYWTGAEFQVVARLQSEGACTMLDAGVVLNDLSRYPWGWLFYLSLSPVHRQTAMSFFENPAYFGRRIGEWERFITKHGFAYDDHEIFSYARRMGAVIHDREGHVVGALGSAGNRFSMPDKKILTIGKKLVAHAEKISRKVIEADLVSDRLRHV